jgi:3-oxoacyl-[acyl-carrier-protein] synthase II
MNRNEPVITGIGVIAPSGAGKEKFWQAIEKGKDFVKPIEGMPTNTFRTKIAGEIQGFKPDRILGPKNLRNLPKSTLFAMAAAQLAIGEAQLKISEKNTDSLGVCTGTTFPHVGSIVEFDREVFKEGINFANPAFFPSTVINATSSQISIRFNIQGFNTTISTGYTSCLEALKYTLNALETGQAKTVITGGVESLDFPMYFGFNKIGYMGGLTGIPLSCPYDKRHNGPLFGEGAAMFCVESESTAKRRKVKPLARIRSVASYFDGYHIARIHPHGEGLEHAIREALQEASLKTSDIDYISGCANSSPEMDAIEVRVLKKIFGAALGEIPVSSIKSMTGETVSASAALQIASVVGAMTRGRIPPTIHHKTPDRHCDGINCVPNKAQKKDVRRALVVSFGPGGYNSACVLERY